MSGFLEKYNTDEVFLRGLITSLLRSLNDKLRYIQINDQQEVLEVFIPFFYSMTGEEPYLQDFFLIYQNCKTDKPLAEGNYDVLPRGIVSYQGSDINAAGLGNKFTRMTYTKEDLHGEMKSYSSMTNSIPLNITFNVQMKIDTVLDSFKIYQSVIQTFYKTYAFSFEYDGFRIPAQVGFPEAYENTKQFEFTYQSQDYMQFAFSIQVETYLPERDLATERFRGNLMQAGIRMQQDISKRALGRDNKEIL